MVGWYLKPKYLWGWFLMFGTDRSLGSGPTHTELLTLPRLSRHCQDSVTSVYS